MWIALLIVLVLGIIGAVILGVVVGNSERPSIYTEDFE